MIGTGEAFTQTLKGREGEHLDEDDRYRDAIDGLDDDRLGHYYVDITRLVDAGLSEDVEGTQGFRRFNALFPVERLGPITGAFIADGDAMVLDSELTDVPDGPLREAARLWSGGTNELMAKLPGDAWAAFGTSDVGEAGEAIIATFTGVLDGAVLSAQIRRGTGLDLQRDVFSWVGDVGGFARGARVADLDGAVVIEATDGDKAAAALRNVLNVVRRQSDSSGSPRRVRVPGAESAFAIPTGDKPVFLARGNGRVVAAFGRAAATDALRPDIEPSEGAGYRKAKDTLGDGLEPALLLSMPALIPLLEETEEPAFEDVRPYLERLDAFVAGGETRGDRVRLRIVAGFR